MTRPRAAAILIADDHLLLIHRLDELPSLVADTVRLYHARVPRFKKR